MPFSESHFSRAQWLFYMIVAFSCLRSVMLLKWNQKRPIFVHFLRNYSVIRDACCCCYCYYCHRCSFDDFIFTRLRSHLMVSNLFYLIHMRNGNESILWMGLFMATNRFHFRVRSYINGKDRFCFRMHVFRFALSLFACGSSFLENWPSTYFNQHHQVKTRIQAHNHPESTRSIPIRKKNNTTNVCMCFGYLPIPFHLWVKACVCACIYVYFGFFCSPPSLFCFVLQKSKWLWVFIPTDWIPYRFIGFRFYIYQICTHSHALTHKHTHDKPKDR